MLGMSGLEGGYCSFHWLEGIGNPFEVHCEKDKERLDMILPSGPVPTSPEVMVGLPFGEDAFNLRSFPSC